MIERLSSTFMDLTDGVLDSQSARRSQPLLRNVLQTMRVFHSIAEDVVATEAGEGLPSYHGEAKATPTSSDDHLQESVHISPLDRTYVVDQALKGSSRKRPRLVKEPLSNPMSEMLFDEYTSPHIQPQILGNGWTYTPVPVPCAPVRQGDHLAHVPEFCLRLVETTVATSYTLLLADTWIKRESEGTFRWSGLYTTREGLLYCMRWMLGPGRKQLVHAVNVPANLYARYLSAGRNITLESDVSDIDNDEKNAHNPTLPLLLNAADVLQKLRDLNCRFVGDDAIEITACAGQPSSTRQKNWFVERFPSRQPPRESSTLTLRLSKALLISNLSYCAICLGRGPGYPMEDFARIVEASATSASESGPLLE